MQTEPRTSANRTKHTPATSKNALLLPAVPLILHLSLSNRDRAGPTPALANHDPVAAKKAKTERQTALPVLFLKKKTKKEKWRAERRPARATKTMPRPLGPRPLFLCLSVCLQFFLTLNRITAAVSSFLCVCVFVGDGGACDGEGIYPPYPSSPLTPPPCHHLGHSFLFPFTSTSLHLFSVPHSHLLMTEFRRRCSVMHSAILSFVRFWRYVRWVFGTTRKRRKKK